MSDWTNLEEIMQDLSLAQGYAVPGRLEAVAAAGPPPIHVPDEASAEQAYYESLCVGGGDLVPPDFKQIKLMLDLVKIDEEKNYVEPRELKPHTPDFVPRQKEKIKINVALSPIEEAKEAVLADRRPVPKATIPTNFKKMIVSHIEFRKEKVLPSQTSQPTPPEKTQQYTPSATMFKKKIKSHTEVRTENVLHSQTSEPTSPERTQQYTPSANASVYYSKYLQKSMLKEQIAEDIWLKAEKQMKEIEARQ